jgi:hypothetical protein
MLYPQPCSFGIQGGVQIATRADNAGGFFINIRGEYDFGRAHTQPPEGDIDISRIEWTRFVIGFSMGYKLGIANRKKD